MSTVRLQEPCGLLPTGTWGVGAHLMLMKEASERCPGPGSGVARGSRRLAWAAEGGQAAALTKAVLHNNAHPCVDHTALLLLALDVWGGHLVSGGRALGVERYPLKCPKCSLVTFDHLPQCPSCSASFRLNRVLTRRRRDPSRPIYLPAASPPETDGVVDSAELPVETRQRGPTEPRPPAACTPPPVVEPATVAEPSPLDAQVAPLEPAPAAPATLPEVPAPVIAATMANNDANGEGHLSLGQLAAAERRRALAASANRRAIASSPAPSSPPEAAENPEDAHRRDAQALKERMMRASRARRKRRPDLVAETIDPVLPGWYEPGIENPAAEPVAAGPSSDR